MAFNPFSVFRRNQKTLFAVLTVFVMFMFVLSFGQGDFFDRIPKWLGNRKVSGEIMAVVDGDKVYESELSRKRDNRTIANQFMAQANGVAANNTFQAVKTGVVAAAPSTQEVVKLVIQLHETLSSERLNDQRLMQILQVFQYVEPQLSAVLADTTKPRDDLDVARAAQHLITLDLQGLAAAAQGYFNNQPNRSNNDLLEFELWRRKAEKLGITYAAEDVRELIAREFFGHFTESDFKELETSYQRNKTAYSKDQLEAALADEFKVRAAQTVVLGPVTSRTTNNPGVHAFSGPYEDYQYFREQCVGATYAMLAVPVANFVPQVQEQPTEKELRDIFGKYRNQEPNPTSDQPGLKEPRKLKLQWVQVSGEEPFYKTAADDTLQKAEAQAKLAGFLLAPLGPVAAGLLAAPAPFVVGDPALATAYQDYKKDFKLKVDTNLFPTLFGSHRPVGPEVVQPANLAAAAGAAAGSLLTGGNPFTAGLVFEQRVAAEARNRRARVGAALFANPLLPGAGIGVPLGAVAAALAGMPQPLPLAVVRAELLAKTKADLARRLAEQDLDKFQTELSKLGVKKDRSEARAYVDAFVKERGLKVGGSAEFHDQYTIDRDAGLAPLKEKMDRGHMPGAAPPRFGREFFFEVDPRQRREVPATTFFAPQAYPQTGMMFPGFAMPVSVREGEPTYLVWRTEEVPAEAPKTFEAAKDKALAAWKETKARDLAKQAAEQLAKETEGFSQQVGTLDQQLRDLHSRLQAKFPDPAAKERAKYDLINDVCPWPIPPASSFIAARVQYQPFDIQTKNIPYPTPEMEQALLKHKDKPFGTALVLPDAGKDVFYVAVVKDRRDVGTDEFFSKVYAAGVDQLGPIISRQHRGQELQQAREDAVALLKAEFKVDKEHAKLAEKVDSSGE